MSQHMEPGAHVVILDDDFIEVHYQLPDQAGTISVSHVAPKGQSTKVAEEYIEAMLHAAQLLDLGSILRPKAV